MNVSVKDYGAVPDTEKVQTKAIQSAIDFCSQSGGGIVSFEAGIYATGTIYLRNSVTLNLPPSCVLKGSDDFNDYNARDAWPQNGFSEAEHANGKHLIVALEVDHVGIVGGGRIDGNGKYFGFRAEKDFYRPSQMVYLCESTYVTIRDVELFNSPYWSCFVYGCDNVILSGLRIKNNPEIQNSDGIDIDASSHVVVSDCLIDTQDDCITFRCCRARLKNKEKALEDVVVTNCQLRTPGCNAFRIGVGTGPIRNCLISNMIIRDSAKAICLEARYPFNKDDAPGCTIENISFNNIYMDCGCPLFLSSHCKGISNIPAPPIRNIQFSNITGKAVLNFVVQSNENSIVDGIRFANIFMEYDSIPKHLEKYGYGEWDYATSGAPFYIANARNVQLDNVHVNITNPDSPFRYAAILHHPVETELRDFVVKKAGCKLEINDAAL